MAEALKDQYSKPFLKGFALELQQVYPPLSETEFVSAILSEEWEHLALKERMGHIADVLQQQLPQVYDEALKVIKALTNRIKESQAGLGFEYMFIPAFVERYGLHDFKASVAAMEVITQFTSCEFAVRPFLRSYPEAMMLQMTLWAQHEHHMVRRLATEGMRPRLPWGLGVPYLKTHPEYILPILEVLKSDPSETVRRSVANNLNDISKDHPDLVIASVKTWSVEASAEMTWLIKHGCRTLLKRGHIPTLRFFGFDAPQHIAVEALNVVTPRVVLGAVLQFEFCIVNTAKTSAKLRLEYDITYQKAHAKLSTKRFKINERVLTAGEVLHMTRQQSFKPITTRTYYAGTHEVALVINGVITKNRRFELLVEA